jgi:hypothetical protein
LIPVGATAAKVDRIVVNDQTGLAISGFGPVADFKDGPIGR